MAVDPFDLGLGEWTEEAKEEQRSEEPPKKKLRLSLSRGNALRDSTNRRFANPVNTTELQDAAKGVIPVKTEASTQWAIKNFEFWARSRASSSTEVVPIDLLRSHDAQLVCKWLCCFVLETRKTDGSAYPPASLRSLVSGLNRELQRNEAPFSVLDKSDSRFRDLLRTLDSVTCKLHKDGVGVVKHSARVITVEHEDVFWEKGVLGYSTPRTLQRTTFFYIGLNFALRGVQEQHDLVPSQFHRVPEDNSVYDESVYYEYHEFMSKNNQHRFKDINSTNKCCQAYAMPGSARCVVRLLDTSTTFASQLPLLVYASFGFLSI